MMTRSNNIPLRSRQMQIRIYRIANHAHKYASRFVRRLTSKGWQTVLTSTAQQLCPELNIAPMGNDMTVEFFVHTI